MVGEPLAGHVEQLTDLVPRPHAGVPEDGVPAVLDEALQVEAGHPGVARVDEVAAARGHARGEVDVGHLQGVNSIAF